MSNVRKYTNKLLELIDEGMYDKDFVINAALGALSESEVERMCRNNDMFLFEGECDGCSDVFHYEGELNEDDLCDNCAAFVMEQVAIALEEEAYEAEAEEMLDDWNNVGSRHHY